MESAYTVHRVFRGQAAGGVKEDADAESGGAAERESRQ